MPLSPILWPQLIGPQLSKSGSPLCEPRIGLRGGQIGLEGNWSYSTDTQGWRGSHLPPVAWRGRRAGVQGGSGKKQRQEAEKAPFPVPGLPGP